MKKLTLLFFIIHFSFFTFHLSEAQIIHVPGPTNLTIQQGIDLANPGDTVLVSDGTYYEQISFLGKMPLMVASQFLLDGDTSHISNTIIDGSLLTDIDNASVVLFTSGEDTTSILSGFTIRGGRGTFVIGLNDRYGGGIFVSNSGAKIINNKVTGNMLDDTQSGNIHGVYGGGIGTRNNDGNFWLVIENNRIYGNTAVTQNDMAGGGGIFIAYNARIAFNEIFENTTTSLSSGWAEGGGLSHVSFGINKTMIVHQNKIHHNIAHASLGVGTDGALGVQYTQLIFTDNEVFANEGVTPAGMGGVGGLAIIDPAQGVVVSGNIFRQNLSTNVGGGIHLENVAGATEPKTVVISDNFFLDNEAREGGAVSVWGIPIIFQNNVCTGNHAINRAGALSLFRSTDISSVHMGVMINNSFYGNTAGFFGGAVYSNKAMPLIFNSVFFNNNTTNPNFNEGKEIYLNHYLDTLDMANSNIDQTKIYGNLHDGGGNFFEDPLFEDTVLLTLLGGSPCIDRGTQTYICSCGDLHLAPAHDILNFPRPFNGAIDIGAYEWNDVGIGDRAFHGSQLTLRSYPNPLNSWTTLEYELIEAGTVNLAVYNNTGQLVATLVDEQQLKGKHQVEWNAEGLPAGIYYCKIKVEGVRQKVIGKLLKY